MVFSRLSQSISIGRLPSPTPEYRPLSFSGPNPDLQKRLADAAEKRIVPHELLSGTFRNELEKHINDVKKNKSYLSPETNKEIRSKHLANSSSLNTGSAGVGSKYSAYYTALDYEQRSRYSTGVNEANRTVQAIQNASHNASQFQQLLAAQPVNAVAGIVLDEAI